MSRLSRILFGDSPSSSLTEGEILDLLANDRRRLILDEFVEAMTLRELSARVAAVENDVPVEELTSQQRKRVYIAIYQVHLDRFVEAGLLEAESDGGPLHATEEFETAVAVLDAVREEVQ